MIERLFVAAWLFLFELVALRARVINVHVCSKLLVSNVNTQTRTVSDSAVSVAPRDLLARRMLAEEEEDMTKTMVRSTLLLFRPRMIQRPEVIIQLTKGIEERADDGSTFATFTNFSQ